MEISEKTSESGFTINRGRKCKRDVGMLAFKIVNNVTSIQEKYADTSFDG